MKKTAGWILVLAGFAWLSFGAATSRVAPFAMVHDGTAGLYAQPSYTPKEVHALLEERKAFLLKTRPSIIFPALMMLVGFLIVPRQSARTRSSQQNVGGDSGKAADGLPGAPQR
jgi:hypothetical protein